ncbi:hypothetical protein ES703_50772 [subsurface metagenome]
MPTGHQGRSSILGTSRRSMEPMVVFIPIRLMGSLLSYSRQAIANMPSPEARWKGV